mgnify:CR=1 FL=1
MRTHHQTQKVTTLEALDTEGCGVITGGDLRAHCRELCRTDDIESRGDFLFGRCGA